MHTTTAAMVRRAGSILVVALLAVTVAACGRGGDGGGGGSASSPGITKDSIKIGGTFPFSGSVAIYGAVSQGFEAHVKAVNAEGGIDGRTIDYTKIDDAYDPARAAANARRLVQQEQVFALVGFGAPATAINDFAASSDVPFFPVAGNAPFSDVEQYPFTRAWWPAFKDEMAVVADEIKQMPDAKVGTIMVANDAGKDAAEGLRAALGDDADKLIVKETTYDPTDADVSSQVNQLRSAGANVLVTVVLGAAEIQMVRYVRQIGYDADLWVYSQSSSIKALMSKMGGAAKGVRSALWLKDPADTQWSSDLDEYRQEIQKYGGGADPEDSYVANGYGLAVALVEALRNMEDPTRESLMSAWDSIDDVQTPILYPDVSLTAVPADGRLIHQYQPVEFTGDSWKGRGAVQDGAELAGGE